jgi:hypothetical protein
MDVILGVAGAIFLHPDIRDLRGISVQGKLPWQRISDDGHSTVPLLRPGYPLSRDLVMGGPDLTRRDPDPIQGTRHAYLGFRDRIWGSGLCVQGFGSSSWRSGPTDCILGHTIFSGHVALLEPSMWWGRVLFTAWLEIAARAPCLHTVVRGTPDSGYRQAPTCFPA